MPATPENIASAADCLGHGNLVAFPTETVYGLGADATSDRAVARIFEAKGRPSFNPLIIHVEDLAAARVLGSFDAAAERLAQAFWPGPLTLVVPRAPGCPISALASAGLDTIALRVPAHETAQALLRACGRPLAAPSANRSGSISPTLAAHVAASLGDRVDRILDAGATGIGLESTIIACLGSAPTLLRPGGLAREAIERCLEGRLADCAADPDRPTAPGQLLSHYAPRAALRLNVTAPAPGEAYLAFGPAAPHDGPMRNLSPGGDLIEAAANLFRLLHELDAEAVSRSSTIAAAPVPHHGLGEAINDRLARAAAPR
nr:L-threonylcarbamoyladenylate synthase [Rhodoligotrophos appendicifer]